MKRKFKFTLCILMILGLVACSQKQDTPDRVGMSGNSGETQENVGNIQLANPFADFDTLNEAQARAGFEIYLPQNMPSGYSATNYRSLVNGGKLLEIIYENKNSEIRFRKGSVENISGVHSDFPENQKVELNGVAVTLSGHDGKIQLATWEKGGFTYSINATTYDEKTYTIGGGLSKEQMLVLVKDMLLHE